MLESEQNYAFRSGKPYLRWWWLSGPFVERDITRQLQWIAANGFGGVELAWIDPSWLEEPERSAPRPAFLSEEWRRLVTYTKREADALGLGCDFTFGSAWPFGGSWLSKEDSAKTFTGLSDQRLGGSWELAPHEHIVVLDHLSASALARYSQPLLQALAPALSVSPSALFCDSLEIATEKLWSPLLWDEFSGRFGYRLEPHTETLDEEPDVRYDYRKLRGEAIRREFYEPFTAMCHRNGALARVQCHGAPTDLLAAYAAVDIPESEALLFLPPFSGIAASAAAWAGANVVSAEAFTCLHGFPGWDDTADELWREERAGDIKLAADALFANGVNQLVWHGMPYQPEGGEQEFYAAVHVGPDSAFAPSLPALNEYFTTVSKAMRHGQTYASLGVYLPNEDAMMQYRIPEEERTPGANFHWEMRHARMPNELYRFAPVWISLAFLKEAECRLSKIVSRRLELEAIYIDCEWLDEESLLELHRLTGLGARIIWKNRPRQPSRVNTGSYQQMLTEAVNSSVDLQTVRPLFEEVFKNVSGDVLEGVPTRDDLPPYWARKFDDELTVFFAHPLATRIRYPLPHRFSEQAVALIVQTTLLWNGREIPVPLRFSPNDGVLLTISASGTINPVSLPRAADFCA